MGYVEVYSLLSAYYDMGHLSRMPLSFGVKAVLKAVEKREEHKAWEMWLMKYQHMDNKNFVPFSKFFCQQRQPIIKPRPAEEVLKEAEVIRKAIEKKQIK